MAAPIVESPPARQGQPSRRPRIAFAHDWLCGHRGGEAVLERIALLVEREFASAHLYTMFDDGRPLSPAVDRLRAAGLIRASHLGTRPGALRLRRWLLPRYPAAVADLSAKLARDHAQDPIDLLISTSSAAIKGIAPPPDIPHLCYCHSPARYVWSRSGEYRGNGFIAALRSVGLRVYAPRFRAWDRAVSGHVTRFLANSSHTASEILRCYQREAGVVFPPVRTDFFTPDPSVPRESFWLVVSALEPYKRIDLAIDAARLAGVELRIAGAGSQRAALQQRAGPGARFLGRVSDDELLRLYRTAAVLIFPQIEDFGIVAAEALACGLPVLARRAGGALDIVQEGLTGVFFDEPSPQAIAAAAARIPADAGPACRAASLRFTEGLFDAAIREAIRELLR